MNCPSCNHLLTEIEVDTIKVDTCDGGCGGLWFDNHEMQKFDEQHEDADERLLNIRRDPAIKIDHSLSRKCPRCEDVVMLEYYSSIKREIEIDECGNCGGIWLDAGELSKYRNSFIDNNHRNETANKLFSGTVDKTIADMRKKRDAEDDKDWRVVRAFRFICPSYYIPGEQDWGGY